jgi:methylenetetrahydrofolate--tRNA-(uracil-5-)-methyltransferase
MNKFSEKKVTVVGGGLAGSECALQLAKHGIPVVLFEMRKKVMTPAHKTQDFAELVCSNSFGSLGETSAPGQLKWEAEQLGSEVLAIAKQTSVPAGQALGVDREVFAQQVTRKVRSHPLIEVRDEVIESLDQIPRPAVIATGPLTHESLAEDLRKHFGDEFLYFFDAISPIIEADTINTQIAWRQDRYDKGTADYLNCPLNQQEYETFIAEVKAARKIEPKHFETTDYFEGCMPIEEIIDRGPETMRFGPMKPVGLRDPRTGKAPHAVVQLRQDNKEATAYNIVGFQTRMAYGEQTRIFKMIPGLENAEFLKLGSIHRNLYIQSPQKLNSMLASHRDHDLYFAGQITGVEGYFESVCMGLYTAKVLIAKLKGQEFKAFPRATAFGSLIEAITHPSRAENFQPTNINFSLFPPLSEELKKSLGKLARDKQTKKTNQVAIAKKEFWGWLEQPTELNQSN